MTKKIVKRTDANNETLYFYTHADAVDVGEGSSTKSLTEVIDDTLHKSAQTLTNAEKTQALTNLGLNGVDEVPTENSNNVVRSGGVKAAIDDFTNRGFIYKGIAPASAPLGEDKAFYIAKSGDYMAYTGIGDGSFTLNGIAVLTYATATTSGAWTKNDIVLFDEEPTPNSDNLVKSGGVKNELALGAVYDVSAKNPTAGPNNDGKWESLSALLSDANLNTLIPISYRKGGMSVKFIQSSDNKYVQFRLMAQSFTTDVSQWQGVDDEPTAGSKNLIESGGMFMELNDEVYSEIELNSVSEKYINGLGNISGSESYTLLYASCSVGDKFKLKYSQNGLSDSAARIYAIYSVDNVNNANSSNNLVIGGKMTTIVADDVIEITVTDATAKLICFQQLVSGVISLIPNVTKQGFANKLTTLNVKIDTETTLSSGEKTKNVSIINNLTIGGEHNVLSAEQGKILKNDLSEYETSNDAKIEDINENLIITDYIKQALTSSVDGSYISGSGNIAGEGTSAEYKVYYIPCSKGDAFKVRYHDSGLSGSIARIYAIYSVDNIGNVSSANLLAIGEKLNTIVKDTDIEITIEDSSAKLICFTEYIGGVKKLVPNVIKKTVESSVKDEVITLMPKVDELDENVFNGGSIKKELSSIQTISGKYIIRYGTIQDGASFSVLCFPCKKGDTFTISYGANGPSESVAVIYGVYETDDIAQLDNHTILSVGNLITSITDGTEYIVSISDNNAKMLCVQAMNTQYISLNPSVKKTVRRSVADDVKDIKSVLANSTLTEIFLNSSESNYIDEKYITSYGSLGTSDTYGCFKIPCVKGNVFELYTFKDLGSSITRNYGIYSSNTTFNSTTLLEVGAVSSVGKVVIDISNYDDAVCLLIGWRTVSDIHLFKRIPCSSIDVLNRDVLNLHYDSIKTRFTYEHELKQTDIRSTFDISENPSTDYPGLTMLQTIMFQLQDKLDELAEANPSYITKFDAVEFVNMQYPVYANGIETEGTYLVTPRYRTYGYKLSYVNPGVNGKSNRPTRILITSGVHGNEQSASLNLYTLVKELCNSYLSDINLFKIRGGFEIYIVPCISGYTAIHRNRLNANGVNINRNFPIPNWDKQGSSDPSANDYRGPYAGSEFETQLIMALLNKLMPDMYIDHHNYSQNDKLQFYTEMTDEHNARLAYDSLADVSFTLKKAFPEWFGSNYALLKGDATTQFVGRAPAEADNTRAQGPVWAFLNGIKFACTIEISGAINYNGGVLSGHDAYCEQVYQIGEYTLVNQIKRYGEYVTNNLVSPRYTDWDSVYIY